MDWFCKVPPRKRSFSGAARSPQTRRGQEPRFAGIPDPFITSAGPSHHDNDYFTFTFSTFRFASSAFGRFTVSTPFLKVASTLSETTAAGKRTERVKEP